MKNPRQHLHDWLFTGLLVCGLIGLFSAAPSHLFAQVADAGGAVVALANAVPAEAAPLGWTQMLIVVLTPLIVAGIKLGLPKLPKLWLPIVAALIGGLCSVVDHFATGADLNVWLGLGLGLAGVGLREATKQIATATKAEPSI